MEGFELWIDGYSNCGVKIKTDWLKADLVKFQTKYPERGYELQRDVLSERRWRLFRTK